jgi:hypothetical protein
LQQLPVQFQLRTGEIIMAHQLEQMAYVGETPWHGLGNQLSPHQPIEVWAQQAGMDWRIESSDVSYMAKNDRGKASSCRMRNSVSCTVLIPMHLYQWSANAFRKFNPKKSLSLS